MNSSFQQDFHTFSETLANMELLSQKQSQYNTSVSKTEMRFNYPSERTPQVTKLQFIYIKDLPQRPKDILNIAKSCLLTWQLTVHVQTHSHEVTQSVMCLYTV